MSAPPVNSAKPANDALTHSAERRHPREDAIARFQQTWESSKPNTTDAEPAPVNLHCRSPRDFEDRDLPAAMPTVSASSGSQPSSFVFAEPAAAHQAIPTQAPDTARLIEQATSVMLGRATRADECRFVVSLDHAIAGGASAEFIRDGAFLHVRLHTRNDAAYRTMWTHRAELEERLAASTGLTTRIEIVEVHGNGGTV
ncbi:hypothetical protein GCM10011487_43810 [Steroidobacter agaridevorans]|uniref:Uncharacterized protein n=1 Tax=Steroidobacter agaridevorans TaxID=2695856 RepID=A0A829YHT0_9GAMM|nr:hypothetical protein [Steroidobacter agaridevorans]GFE82381.1 hypothetical protein GCM10011487_43810 [Steroidobacter agaridevorans]GFE85230.1 hypothetical protein GCM10011488_01840 [Steroidobacter agaridevorans]